MTIDEMIRMLETWSDLKKCGDQEVLVWSDRHMMPVSIGRFVLESDGRLYLEGETPE